KDSVPGLQLEVFVHGAMCMAYSGRCLLSSFLTGRSANQGDCAHTCRWNYRLEESEREGVFFPVEEQDGYTTILSSKDLCMIDHIRELEDSGVDSLKIEGRMKSSYYVAVVTRAYRKAIDKDVEWMRYREDLMDISHREYCTGFFYDKGPVEKECKITEKSYLHEYLFLGFVKEEIKPGIWSLDLRNQIRKGQTLEYLGVDIHTIEDTEYILLDSEFQIVDQIDHCKTQYLQTSKPVRSGYIIRRLNE
ncbi:MAG: U32 family peptidase C-terminal domain-containing protein, partial [Sphaerochaetaceae bacterium]